MNLINQLAELVGIQSSYIDNQGQQVYTTEESRDALLRAMGYSLDDPQQIEQAIVQFKDQPWLTLLPPVTIINAEDPQYSMEVTIEQDQQSEVLSYTITTEDHQRFTQTCAFGQLQLTNSHQIADKTYQRYRLPLEHLPLGYHRIQVQVSRQQAESQLIVAPKTCYNPSEVADFKMWGLAAQLYSLKKDQGWGIGDFSDLKQLINQAATKGASVIGLNPLHPLYPGNPAHRSPYSPTSRCFLNSLYIDVTQIENFAECKPLNKLMESAEFKTKIQQLNQAEHIDYSQTAECKYQALELLYTHFHRNHVNKNSELAAEFSTFKQQMGEQLYTFATFDALYEHFRKKDNNAYSWMDWPDRYQDPDSDYVKKFQNRHSRRIDYFMYLQWLADRQLASAAQTAKDQQMPVGLYLDLAVGCNNGGAEVWANKKAFVAGVGVGAPPDMLNPMGQNWGLSPINPVTLRQQAYQPLINALRSNMRHAGALRIDHVFGLQRQYWVGEDMPPTQGAYINFPIDDILRIIALESRRAQCIVVGEDLGTTPAGFAEIMAGAGLLSYKVLYFERWESGLFQRPEIYPEQAMVTVSTHDMPTLSGWWAGRDLDWREQLQLYPQQQMAEQERHNRQASRQMLLDALQDAQVLAEHQHPEEQANLDLSLAVQQFLARSPGQIQMIPLEDALGMLEQVNIPGTVDEHPNWLQRLPYTVEESWQQPHLNSVVNIMQKERPINP